MISIVSLKHFLGVMLFAFVAYYTPLSIVSTIQKKQENKVLQRDYEIQKIRFQQNIDSINANVK